MRHVMVVVVKERANESGANRCIRWRKFDLCQRHGLLWLSTIRLLSQIVDIMQSEKHRHASHLEYYSVCGCPFPQSVAPTEASRLQPLPLKQTMLSFGI